MFQGLLSLTPSVHVAQLFGNPLELLPELSPCASLRHLSLANARISADDDFENWTVEVSAAQHACALMVH